jgi:hypothetical protein
MKLKFKARRLLKYSHSYLIVLPIAWVENLSLKKGDFITMEMNENNDLVLKKMI